MVVTRLRYRILGQKSLPFSKVWILTWPPAWSWYVWRLSCWKRSEVAEGRNERSVKSV